MRRAFLFRNLGNSEEREAVEGASRAPSDGGGGGKGRTRRMLRVGKGSRSRGPSAGPHQQRMGGGGSAAARGRPRSPRPSRSPGRCTWEPRGTRVRGWAYLSAPPPPPQVWFKNRRAKWRHQKRTSASARLLPGAKKPPKESC